MTKRILKKKPVDDDRSEDAPITVTTNTNEDNHESDRGRERRIVKLKNLYKRVYSQLRCHLEKRKANYITSTIKLKQQQQQEHEKFEEHEDHENDTTQAHALNLKEQDSDQQDHQNQHHLNLDIEHQDQDQDQYEDQDQFQEQVENQDENQDEDQEQDQNEIQQDEEQDHLTQLTDQHQQISPTGGSPKQKKTKPRTAKKPLEHRGTNKTNLCAIDWCNSPSIPLTKFCFAHILHDKSQKLFRGCLGRNYLAQVCGYPILISQNPPYCMAHIDLHEFLSNKTKRLGQNQTQPQHRTAKSKRKHSPLAHLQTQIQDSTQINNADSEPVQKNSEGLINRGSGSDSESESKSEGESSDSDSDSGSNESGSSSGSSSGGEEQNEEQIPVSSADPNQDGSRESNVSGDERPVKHRKVNASTFTFS